MIPLNKIFFFALFISTIPTTALCCQKDEPQKFSKLSLRAKQLSRSKSLHRVTTKKRDKKEESNSITRARSNSTDNQLQRSLSFKGPRPETLFINNIPLDKRFSRLESYMKSRPDLLHTIIGELKPKAQELFITDKEGVNLLHLAAKYDRLVIAYVLIKKGIDINSTTHAGKTALNIARENRNVANNDEARIQHEDFIEFIEINRIPFTY
jgi:hypothetical protein